MINHRTILVIIAGFASTCQAQETPQGSEATSLLQTTNVPKGLIPNRYILSTVINFPGVAEEVHLSEKQISEWKKIQQKHQSVQSDMNKAYNTKVEDTVKQIRALTKHDEGEEREKLDSQLSEMEQGRRQQVAESARSLDSQLLKILNQKQESRLRQILLQAEGSEAFERENVQTQLGLVPEQVLEIRRISKDTKQKFRRASELPKVSDSMKAKKGTEDKAEKDSAKDKKEIVDKIVDKMVTAKADAIVSIEKLLSATQRQIYRKMIGEPFDFMKQHRENAKTGVTSQDKAITKENK